MSDPVIGVDAFAATMAQILGGIPSKLDNELVPAARKAAQKGRREVRRKAASAGFKSDTKTGGEYVSGWTYRVRATSHGIKAEIGNSKAPGLVHLLEKGHAKVGGGRVRAFPHVADAAKTTFDEFEEQVGKAVSSL